MVATKTARILDFKDATGAAGQNGVDVYLSAGNFISINIYKGSATAVLASVTTTNAITTAGSWYYVAVSFSSTTLKPTFYNSLSSASSLAAGVDGTASTSAPSCTSLTSNFIGKTNAAAGGSDVNLDAALNDVKIYNTALSSDQLKANFLSEKSMLTYL